MKNNFLNKILFSALIIGLSVSAFAQNWQAPASEKDKTSPIPFSTKTKQEGKDIFNKNCKSCHGEIGKNNPVALSPNPGDPASEKFSVNTDGELFYKITTGKGAMPKFKDIISENERWAVISYIRSFHPDYKPANTNSGDVVEEESFNGKNLKLFVNLDQVNLEANVEVQGDVDGETKAANGVRVGFFIKRTFGLLPVCEPVTTDNNGLAKAIFPKDLPGDSTGNYEIIIKLIDNDLYGDVVYKEKINWGKSFVYENPLDHRALWGNRSNAPWWLLITYFALLGPALIVIVWVMLQLKKLKGLGK